MSNLRLTFKKNLAIYIKKSGITQVELAQKIGVGKGNVTNWLNGKSIPDLDVINKICAILNIPISIMLGVDVLRDEKKRQLIVNYELLNDDGQEDLLKFSEMLVKDLRKIKKETVKET